MEPVHVRCPVCLRDRAFVIPVYTCPCGAPTALRTVRGAPATVITQRVWADCWVTARCAGCGREDHWPQPELGCPCGTVLRVPVRTEPSAAPGTDPESGHGTAPEAGAEPPAHIPLPRTAPPTRPPFRPLPVRTARDAVTAAGLYLGWLGFQRVTQALERPASRVDLRADGALAQVETSTCPTGVREIECLWLNALSESVSGVFFSLAGYEETAVRRADLVSMPLFSMDLTGTPQPVNGAAEDLLGTGT
ncbi:hypothetical protein [Streptomyces sp. NPDC001770]